MMDLQAAIGIHQLSRVEQAWERRREIWAQYQQAFCDTPVGTPAEPESDTRHGHHLYALTLNVDSCGLSRDEFLVRMQEFGIGVGVHYQCLAVQPYYTERYGWQRDDYPTASAFGDTTVSLPLSARLTEAEVNYIIDTTRSVVGS
jgi:dTDP-4-amino-4,6-dideoxygalactose transaminase